MRLSLYSTFPVFRSNIIDAVNRVYECASNITCFATCLELATREVIEGWVGWGEGRGTRQMLIRWCSGHPFFDPPASSLSLSLLLSFSLSVFFCQLSLVPFFLRLPLPPCRVASVFRHEARNSCLRVYLALPPPSSSFLSFVRPSVRLLVVSSSHNRNVHVR